MLVAVETLIVSIAAKGAVEVANKGPLGGKSAEGDVWGQGGVGWGARKTSTLFFPFLIKPLRKSSTNEHPIHPTLPAFGLLRPSRPPYIRFPPIPHASFPATSHFGSLLLGFLFRLSWLSSSPLTIMAMISQRFWRIDRPTDR